MSTMPPVPEVTEAQIVQLLAAARETIADVPFCWLATRSAEGGTNARAVRSSTGAPGSDEWTRRFLAYQHPSGDRYVALGGRATIVEDTAEMRTMWSSDLDAHFPPGFADANMIVIRVDVDRIEVHARGLTREPFGHGRTLLERQPAGSWRFIPAW